MEIKARARDWAGQVAAAEALGGPGRILDQVDTFYGGARGRLKLRRVEPDHVAQLILYARPDLPGPKTSSYQLVPVADPDGLAALLDAAYGAVATVRKRRLLVLVGPTRIHLDQVEGLGAYIEFEVVLQPGQSEAEGQAIAADLMAKLGIAETDLVAGAYADLLADGGRP